MDEQQALGAIISALRKALNDNSTKVSIDTDLIEDEILDSLDGMVFILELSAHTDKQFPPTDLVDLGFYKVRKLVEFLTTP